MNEYSTLQLIIDILVALGTLAVAILAIWGEWFRNKLVAPKLELKLRDTKGHITNLQNGQKVIYYHLVVTNKRKWAIARGVQVVLESVYQRAADGTFKADALVSDVPFIWTFPQFSQITPNISDQKICDFGHLSENEKVFKPELYFLPNNFNGFVSPNNTIQYSIRVKGENFTSGESKIIEISWDGKW